MLEFDWLKLRPAKEYLKVQSKEKPNNTDL